jgi:hypothetical protein
MGLVKESQQASCMLVVTMVAYSISENLELFKPACAQCQVRVRAHDLVDGFGGREVVVDLAVPSGENFEVEASRQQSHPSQSRTGFGYARVRDLHLDEHAAAGLGGSLLMPYVWNHGTQCRNTSHPGREDCNPTVEKNRGSLTSGLKPANIILRW